MSCRIDELAWPYPTTARLNTNMATENWMKSRAMTRVKKLYSSHWSARTNKQSPGLWKQQPLSENQMFRGEKGVLTHIVKGGGKPCISLFSRDGNGVKEQRGGRTSLHDESSPVEPSLALLTLSVTAANGHCLLLPPPNARPAPRQASCCGRR
jgi:hypothetical protein